MKSLYDSIRSNTIAESILSSTNTGMNSLSPWYKFISALKTLYPSMKYYDFDENHTLYIGFHKGARMTYKEFEKIFDLLEECGCNKYNGRYYLNTEQESTRDFLELAGRDGTGRAVFFATYFKSVDEEFKSLHRNSVLGSQEKGDFVFQLRTIDPYVDEYAMKQVSSIVKKW